MAAEQVARLARGHHEQRAVEIGEIIDASILRAMHRLKLFVRRAAAIDRGVVARAGDGERRERAEDRQRAQHRVGEDRRMRLAPAPVRRVGAEAASEVADGVGQRRLQQRGAIAAAPVRAGRATARRRRTPPAGRRRSPAMPACRRTRAVEVLHPGVEDQRLRRVQRHRAVPVVQQRPGRGGRCPR